MEFGFTKGGRSRRLTPDLPTAAGMPKACAIADGAAETPGDRGRLTFPAPGSILMRSACGCGWAGRAGS